MDETTTAPTPEPITPEGPGGPLQNLIDLYFEPRKTFGRIVKNPAWVLPFAGYLILVLVFAGVWLNNLEPAEFMKGQLQESGQWDKLTPEQREGVIDQQAKFIPIFSWVSAFVATPIVFLVVSGALLFMFRFFYAGEVSFKQALAIVCWSFLAFAIISKPLTHGVMAMKDDWNITPRRPFKPTRHSSSTRRRRPNPSGPSSAALISSPSGSCSSSPRASAWRPARRRARPSGGWPYPGRSSSP